MFGLHNMHLFLQVTLCIVAGSMAFNVHRQRNDPNGLDDNKDDANDGGNCGPAQYVINPALYEQLVKQGFGGPNFAIRIPPGYKLTGSLQQPGLNGNFRMPGKTTGEIIPENTRMSYQIVNGMMAPAPLDGVAKRNPHILDWNQGIAFNKVPPQTLSYKNVGADEDGDNTDQGSESEDDDRNDLNDDEEYGDDGDDDDAEKTRDGAHADELKFKLLI